MSRTCSAKISRPDFAQISRPDSTAGMHWQFVTCTGIFISMTMVVSVCVYMWLCVPISDWYATRSQRLHQTLPDVRCFLCRGSSPICWCAMRGRIRFSSNICLLYCDSCCLETNMFSHVYTYVIWMLTNLVGSCVCACGLYVSCHGLITQCMCFAMDYISD